MSDSISPGDGGRQGTIQAGRYLWIVLPLTTGAIFAQGLMRQGLPVLYPFIQSEFGLSRAQIGLITSAQAIGFSAVVALAGWLTDILGVKRIITIALLSLTAFILAFPLAYSFVVILALAVFMGIVTSPIHPSTTLAIMDWFPVRIRALAMSIKQMGIPIAGTVTAAILPALAIVIGWRMAAAVTGLLVLAIAISFIMLYHNAPRGIPTVHKFNLDTLKTMLRKRCLVATIIWGAILVGFQFTVVSYFMLFMIEELGLSPITAGVLLAIAQVSSMVTRVLWGAASDFIFQGRRMVVLAITGFITVLWMLGASLTSVGVPSITVYLLAIAIGISTLAFHGVFITLIGEQAEPGQVGVTIGVASMVNHATQVVMPPLFGYLVDISNSYSLVWRLAAAVVLACTLALLTFGKEPQRP
ncbi:MFS transporter [Chloroflexota bacterium]